MFEPVRQAGPLQNLSRHTFCIGTFAAPDEPRHHGVFQGREFRQKMMELKDKPDVTVAKSSQLRSAPLENILLFKEHLAARRRIQTAKQMK